MNASFRFRRLAIQYNPERQKDKSIQAVFGLIAEAYDVLSDPLRRAVYDQYGEAGLKRGVPGPQYYIQPYVFHGEPLKTYRSSILFEFLNSKCFPFSKISFFLISLFISASYIFY